MNKTSKNGFAFLLVGIMVSPMALLGGALQWVAIVGWLLGFAGLMMVLGDVGDEKDKNSVDDSKDQQNNDPVDD